MIIEKIKFSKEFIHPHGNQWIGIEVCPEPGQGTDEIFMETVKRVNEWYKMANPHADISSIGSIPVREVERGNPVSLLIDGINSCMDVKVLETYKLLIKNNPAVQQVYDKKMAELKK